MRLLAGVFVMILLPWGLSIGAASVSLADPRPAAEDDFVDEQGHSRYLSPSVYRPAALASGDFDADGVPDLACAYSDGDHGLVVLHLGNGHAIHPSMAGAETAPTGPFLPSPRGFALPAIPDLLYAGDFDGDGHVDIVAGTVGGDTLFLKPGSSDGQLGATRTRRLPGSLTALVSGDINRADGLPDLVAGVVAASGAAIAVLEGRTGAWDALAEMVPVPEPISSLALGRLDEDVWTDIAAATGREVHIVSGRDRSPVHPVEDDRGPQVTRMELAGPIKSLVVGDLVRDALNRQDIGALLSDGTLLRLDGSADWVVADTRKLDSIQGDLLSPVRTSGDWTDDLALGGASSLALVRGIDPGVPAFAPAIDLEGTPVAVLPMRLNADALGDLLVLTEVSPIPWVVESAPLAIFTVTNTAEAGTGSLRTAITNANGSAGADLINFDIPGAGPHIIPVSAGALPDITGPVTIDGYSQSGAQANSVPAPGASNAVLKIALDGSLVPLGGGLVVDGGNSTIRGLAIYGFPGDGIQITSVTNIVEGNYLSTDITGMSERRNDDGVEIAGGINNTIGGTQPAARNVISGADSNGVDISTPSSTANKIQGNYIGTNVNGTGEVGNDGDGIEISASGGNLVGGTSPTERNIISGNDDDGIFFDTLAAAGNLVQGNYIGVDVNGTAALPNDGDGLLLRDAPNNIVGGTTVGARNIIAGNIGNGLSFVLSGASGNRVEGNYIGVDVNGTAPMGNGFDGVRVSNAPSNIIGGSVAGAGNVISSNGSHGITLALDDSALNRIVGNFIGTDASGSVALGNTVDGVRVSDSTGNEVGGTTAEERNVISGNGERGVLLLLGATNTDVTGNYIGTNVDGTADLGNGEEGVRIFEAAGNTIGGSSAGERNIISGNDGQGVTIDSSVSSGNRILGNYIGTDVSGSTFVGNSMSGVRVTEGFGNVIGGTTSGQGNLIAGNGIHGVVVLGNSAIGNQISSNAIHSNGGLGIDLGSAGVTPNDVGDGDLGPNRLQNFPLLGTLFSTFTELTASGTLNAAAGETFRLEFFANRTCDPTFHGEGQIPLAGIDVTTSGTGDAVFVNVALPPVAPGKELISATATDALGNTSEFSECRLAACIDFHLFGQTVLAADRDTLVWQNPADIVTATGDLADVSTFSSPTAGAQDNATSLDISADPAVGAGYYYLVRPRGCGSYETSAGAEPGRDTPLP